MRPVTKVLQAFANLKVRPKLMIAHNLFFLIFAGTVWYALVPRIEEGVADARERETRLIRELFSKPGTRSLIPNIAAYDFRTGSAAALGVRNNFV